MDPPGPGVWGAGRARAAPWTGVHWGFPHHYGPWDTTATHPGRGPRSRQPAQPWTAGAAWGWGEVVHGRVRTDEACPPVLGRVSADGGRAWSVGPARTPGPGPLALPGLCLRNSLPPGGATSLGPCGAPRVGVGVWGPARLPPLPGSWPPAPQQTPRQILTWAGGAEPLVRAGGGGGPAPAVPLWGHARRRCPGAPRLGSCLSRLAFPGSPPTPTVIGPVGARPPASLCPGTVAAPGGLIKGDAWWLDANCAGGCPTCCPSGLAFPRHCHRCSPWRLRWVCDVHPISARGPSGGLKPPSP